jgi:hypothetical protein
VGKKLGTVAIVLGAFLLVLAALSKFYMYDRLAVVPLNQETTSISATEEGADGTILDIPGGLKEVQTPLKSTRVVQGDVEASKEASDELDRDVAVWKTFVCTDRPDFDCSSGDTPLASTYDVVAFDRHTGEAVSWDGTRTESNGTTVRGSFEGQYFKFPFDTKKKDYKFWDGTIKQATTAKFVKETELEGMKVYQFEQVIEPTKTGTIAVPGTLAGVPNPTVTADRIYSNTRVLNVEPTTGVIIRGGETQDGWLEYQGERIATTTEASLQYTDQNVKDTVDEYSSKVTLLNAIQTWIPLGGLILGLVLIGLGVVLVLRKRAEGGESRATDERVRTTA